MEIFAARPAYVAVPTAMAPYPEFSEAGSMMTLEVQDQTKNSLWDDHMKDSLLPRGKV